MKIIRELSVSVALLITVVLGLPVPGGSYHHIHHRIHVPQKIKTVYHTKIIKVPEHHHHFHEKEKIIIEKEKPKEEHHPLLLEHEDHHDWEGLGSENLYKKKRNAHHGGQAGGGKSKKKRVVRHPYPYRKSHPGGKNT